MKFLYFGDRHYSASKVPPNRIDNFLETTKNKDLEIIKIAKDNNVTAFLQPGDFFNEKDVRGENEFISEIVGRWNLQSPDRIPIIGVAGNHDLIGNSIDTLNDTTLGLLNNLNLLNLVSKENPMFFTTEDGLKIAITGTNYHLEQDEKEFIDDYIVKEKLGDVHIHITHGMLSDKDMGKLIKHTLIDNIVDTKADITLCGHNHIGFGIKEINDKYFINIGSVTRYTGDIKEMSRKPSVALIDISKEGIKIENIPLESAPEGSLVIDRSILDEERKKKAAIAKFRKEAESMKTSTKPDMSDFVDTIAKNELIPDEIRDDILNRLVEKEKMNATIKAVANKSTITKIVLENFQSHKYNEFELNSGLNVFVGETRQGKSAILRAFYWVYENKPSGKSFIKRGEPFARVSVYLSDGTIVSRFVEEKRNGKNGYEILYPDGTSETGNTKLIDKVQKLLGFNNFYIDQKLSLPVNFYKQGESWYLIGNNQTSTDKARIIGALAGTNNADAIIRDLDTENTRQLVSYKTAKQKKEEIEKDIESLEYLDGLKISLDKTKDLIDKYNLLKTLKETLETNKEKRISLVKKIEEKENILKELETSKILPDKIKDIKEKQLKLDEINKSNKRYQKTNMQIASLTSTLEALKDINNTRILVEKVKNTNKTLDNLSDLNNKITTDNEKIKKYTEVINRTDELEFLSDACKMLRDAEIELTDLRKEKELVEKATIKKRNLDKKIGELNSKIKATNNIEKTKKLLETIKNNNSSIEELQKSKKKYIEKKTLLEKETSKFKNLEENVLKSKETYSKTLEEAEICPICKEPLSKDKIHRIVYQKNV